VGDDVRKPKQGLDCLDHPGERLGLTALYEHAVRSRRGGPAKGRTTDDEEGDLDPAKPGRDHGPDHAARFPST
jgi:hypothetical protein